MITCIPIIDHICPGLECTQTEYVGSVCLLELQDHQYNISQRQNRGQNTTEVLISSAVNQNVQETFALQLFSQLQLLNASQECVEWFKWENT